MLSPLASLPFLASVENGGGPTERYLLARCNSRRIPREAVGVSPAMSVAHARATVWLYIVQLPEDVNWVLASSFVHIYSIVRTRPGSYGVSTADTQDPLAR